MPPARMQMIEKATAKLENPFIRRESSCAYPILCSVAVSAARICCSVWLGIFNLSRNLFVVYYVLFPIFSPPYSSRETFFTGRRFQSDASCAYSMKRGDGLL